MADLFSLTYVPALSRNNIGIPGAQLQFFEAGTSTPAPIYTDDALTVEHTNPVIAGADAKFPNIYLDPAIVYRVRLLDANGVPLPYEVDPYRIPTTIPSVGLFVNLDSPVISADIVRVSTTGHHTVGMGAGDYVYDSDVNAAWIAARTYGPRIAFIAADGRGWRLTHDGHLHCSAFGTPAPGNRVTNEGNFENLTDASAALQAFFDWGADQNNPPLMDFQGVWGWGSNTGLVINQPPVRRANFMCGVIVAMDGTSGDSLVTIAEARFCHFFGEFYAKGTGGGTYTGRTWNNGFEIREFARAQADYLRTHSFKRNGIWHNTASFSSIGAKVGIERSTFCGSNCQTTPSVQTLTREFTARTDTGSSGGSGQRSVLTLDGGVPSEIESGDGVLILDEPHTIKEIDTGAGTIALQGWILPLSLTTGQVVFLHGGGTVVTGGNSADLQIGMVESSNCGIGTRLSSAYGAIMGDNLSQQCAVPLWVGNDFNENVRGFSIDHLHFEGSKYEVVFNSANIYGWLGIASSLGTSIDSRNSSLLDKCVTMAPTTSSGTRTARTANVTWVIDNELYYSRSTNNYTITQGTETLSNRVGERDKNVYLNSLTISLDWDDPVGRMFGQHSRVWLRGFGTGPNANPTGTYTFTPRAREYAGFGTTDTSTTVTYPETANYRANNRNLHPGLQVSGTGIPGGATIVSVDRVSGTFELSAAATATGTITITVTPTVNGSTSWAYSGMALPTTFEGYYDRPNANWVIHPERQMLHGVTTRGDTAVTLTVGDKITQRFTTELTADRAITLSATGAKDGDKFTIVRPATGAFNLNVGTGPLKALATGQWCDVEYDGSAWVLTRFGSL